MEADLSFPLYERARQYGILDGTSALIVAPTASGKSYIGQDIIIRNLANTYDTPVIHAYLVPYRALAAEVYDDFRHRLGDDGARIRLVTGDHRDPVNPENSDFVVATYESFDGLLRSGKIIPGTVVADEVHLINDTHRGPVVEGMFARLKKEYPDSNLIALSAVIENPEDLAAWLKIELLKGKANDRPVPLDITYEFTDDKFEVLYETLQPATNGSQALVFCNSRSGAEKTARELAEHFFSEYAPTDNRQYELSGRIKAEDESLSTLGDLVLKGVGYHHAGLTKNIRKLLEEGYRAGYIKMLTSTPTLAAGVNLPADITVVRDVYRAETVRGKTRQTLISGGEILNMLGRAGRPNHSGLAKGLGIALIPKKDKSGDHIKKLLESLEKQHGGKVHSHLANSFEAIMRFALSVIVDLGEATREDIKKAYEATFAHFEDHEKVSYDRPFEEDMMEDIPNYQKVKDADGNIFLKDYALSSDGVVATIASKKDSGKVDNYKVEIGVTGVTCSCPAARRWHRHEVCKHEACAIHELLFSDKIEKEAQTRAWYNCGHIFARTLDPGTKLINALKILTSWGLLERIPNGWRPSPVGELAINTTFDLLLVRQIIEHIRDVDEADYKTVAQWAVNDYFAEEAKRKNWKKTIDKWLDEIPINKIKLPTKYRGDFDHGLDDLSQICSLYEKTADALGKDDLAKAAHQASRSLQYGVKPELVPLIGLDLSRLKRASCRRLYDAGIKNVKDLSEADPEKISKITHAPHENIKEWIAKTKEIQQSRSVTYGNNDENNEDPEIDDIISRFRIDPDSLTED